MQVRQRRAALASRPACPAHLCSVPTAAVRALAAVRYASASDRASFTSHSCSSSSVPSSCCCRPAWRCMASSWRCSAPSWRRAPRRPSRSVSASAPTSSAWSPSASRSAAAAVGCGSTPAAADAVACAARAVRPADAAAAAGTSVAGGGGVSATARRALPNATPPASVGASGARSAVRRSAASCSVCRRGEGEPSGKVGLPSTQGERTPLGVDWRVAGVDASGVLPLLPPRSSLATQPAKRRKEQQLEQQDACSLFATGVQAAQQAAAAAGRQHEQHNPRAPWDAVTAVGGPRCSSK